MPLMKVAAKIRPYKGGFEMEVRAVDSFYKWRKKYKGIGDAYMDAVELDLATVEGDPAGRLSFVKRTLKLEAWVETERLERYRFRLC
jgi:hypothetical protein